MTSKTKWLNDNELSNENSILWNLFEEQEQHLLEAEKTRKENQQLKQKIESLEQENNDLNKLLLNHTTDQDCSELFIKAFEMQNSLTVSECLYLIASLFKERVIILKEAFASASASDAYFTQTDRLFSLLFKLLTKGFKLKQKSGASFYEIFTSEEYSAKESETTDKNSQLRKQRTFLYRGKAVYVPAHLKIGVASNIATTLRVYFFFDTDTNKIIISYCGQHLGLLK